MDASRHNHALGSKEKRFPRKQTCLSIYSRCVNSSDRLDHTHERFDHILVDEYQDTNRLQSSIACGRSIATLPSWVTMRRASTASAPPKCATFSISPPNFPARTVVTLETNYRSTQPILDVTNRIIGLSPKRHAKELRSVKGYGPKPALITCEREEDQTDFVVEKILEHNGSGLGLRRQAILVRTTYWSDHLEVELTRRNIPYRKYGGLKFLETAHIKDLMSFLRVLENPRDQLAWTRILRLLEGVGPAVACEAVAESGATSQH
jgi:DNA helicase-2/ATP-dependent DNA helicase PcrA